MKETDTQTRLSEYKQNLGSERLGTIPSVFLIGGYRRRSGPMIGGLSVNPGNLGEGIKGSTFSQ